jgi:hypothetical protein
MSRGELIVEDNQVKPSESAWADEFHQENVDEKWAAEFTAGEVLDGKSGHPCYRARFF